MSKATKRAEAPVTVAEKTPETVVYLGPTIPKCVNHGTVFTGGIPAYLEAKITKIPAMRGLIVPVSQYAETAKAIKVPGRIRTLYETVKKSL